MIKFRCNSCNAGLRVGDDRAGRRGKCPKCGAVLTVPSPTSAAEAEPTGEASAAQAAGAATVQTNPRCEVCGAELTFNLPNCHACGALLRKRPKAARAAEGPSASAAGPAAGPGARCPSCGRSLGHLAKICVQCGVKIPSGRPVLMRRDIDHETLKERSREIVRPLSLLIWFGLYPITSEAIGRSKPYLTWAITVLTIIVSVWFFAANSDDTGSPWVRDLMLWPPKSDIELEDYETFYVRIREEYGQRVDEMQIRAAYNRDKRQIASRRDFRSYQLVTHALLHGGIMHLVGNLIFLIVLGKGVNAALGNIATLISYVILAALAGWAQLMADPPTSITPMVGASGAIMGLAGMYVVLFPLHKISMTIWLRVTWLMPPLHAVFALWGFIVVAFYIAFDVVYTILGMEDGVAHWAHLGGFFAGMALAVMFLACRAVHTGGDVLSLALGRYAWPLIGKPAGRVGKKGFGGLW